MPTFFRLLRLLPLFAMALLLLTACATSTPAAQGRFLPRDLQLDGKTYHYQVFVPASYRKRRSPVVLFLHGSGERGADNQTPLTVGLPPYVRAHQNDFPALVVIPQAPEGSEWTGSAGAIAMAALEATMKEFPADPDRIYLSGLSMGGYGTWELALQYPTKFAALVPVCGGITVDWTDSRPEMSARSVAGAADPFAATAQRLRHVPVWIFHGGKDDVVPPAQSQRMQAALQQAGGDVRYTEFPDANHNSWDAAYATDALWAWLFRQHR